MVRLSRLLSTAAVPTEPKRKAPDTARPPEPPPLAAATSGGQRRATQQLVARAVQTSRQLQKKELLRRLQAAAVLDRAMLFAALLMLLMFPFMIVMSVSIGRDFSTGLSRRMGLSSRASQIVSDLFAHGASSSAGSTASWSLLLIFGIVAVAGALQRLYEDLYGLPPAVGLGSLTRRMVWVASFLLTFVVMGELAHLLDGRLVLAAVWFCSLAGFFWWTLYWLLSRRIAWRRLLPSAAFTAVFYIGLGVFSSLYFSNVLESNYRSYGPIGAVLGMMSWLVAVAVVLILGSICGLVWESSGLSLRKAASAVRRSGRRQQTVPPEVKLPGSSTRRTP